ncbi:unnamed protein product [Aspergillus oryzae var. brunneus]|uniref:Unnamed protein product n=2 Tax=Aspergillus oryzae TaxID=5062 RepID=A0AAN4YTZ8_ASPOZ|nr:unnamed protein product [Aspergillus oryzae]GMG51319.1 unnamed protein product [Aspergillus oryzae var. brunneus]
MDRRSWAITCNIIIGGIFFNEGNPGGPGSTSDKTGHQPSPPLECHQASRKNQSSSSKSSVPWDSRARRRTSELKELKTAPRNIVKAFVERDQDVKLLRERSESLQALSGVELQREQWYPIKLDAARKTDVFDDLEKEKSDF